MSPRQFKAMVVSETTDKHFTKAITMKSVDDLPQGDVLIRVHYSSLNYKDVLSAQGNRGVTRSYPHTPGIDAAGIVEESSSQNFLPGDSVLITGYDLGMNTSGGFAEYIRVPESWVVPLPDNLSLKESMMYGTAGFTAGLSCHRLIEHGLTPDHGQILVSGATGGVGGIAVSILSMMGFHVTAVNGHHDRSDYLKSIGATDIISMDEATDKGSRPLLEQRWAGVVDAVGGTMLSTSLRTVQRHGIVTTCGNVGSGDLITTVYPFILRGITLAGIDSATTPMSLRRHIWGHLAGEWKIPHLTAIAQELPDLESLDHQIDCVVNHERTGRAIVKVS